MIFDDLTSTTNFNHPRDLIKRNRKIL